MGLAQFLRTLLPLTGAKCSRYDQRAQTPVSRELARILTYRSVEHDKLVGGFEVLIPKSSDVSPDKVRVFQTVVNKYSWECSKNLFDKGVDNIPPCLLGIRTIFKEPGFRVRLAEIAGDLSESLPYGHFGQHFSAYVDKFYHTSGNGVARWILVVWRSFFVAVVNVEVMSILLRLENSIVPSSHPGLEVMHE